MSEKKPIAIYAPPARRTCPVCGKVAYSSSGEHPQCAVNRADIAFKAHNKQRLR